MEDYLQERLNRETSEQGFSNLPFRFTEISKVLLDVCVIQLTFLYAILIPQCIRASDDLENPDKLRTLLKDLREARQAKSRDGLKTLDHSELSVCTALHRDILMTLINSFQTFARWRSTKFGLSSFSP
jgi:GINS complex subunit 2